MSVSDNINYLFDSWKEEFAAEWAWLERTAPRWHLAASFIETLERNGSLSPRQMEVIHNGMQRDADRAPRKAVTAVVDRAGIDRLKASFDQAIAFSAEKGLKLSPRLTIDGLTISLAKETSRNPGALYVKQSKGERTYLGKIADGQFFASRDCTEDQKTKVLAFVADPAEAAKVYGQTTGTCCVCNATLRSEWRLRGIGPICAQKFGW